MKIGLITKQYILTNMLKLPSYLLWLYNNYSKTYNTYFFKGTNINNNSNAKISLVYLYQYFIYSLYFLITLLSLKSRVSQITW